MRELSRRNSDKNLPCYIILTDNAEGLWFSRWENPYTARFARGILPPRPIISHSTAPLAIRHRTVDLHKRSNEDIITTWKVSSAFDRPRCPWISSVRAEGHKPDEYLITISRDLKTKLKFIQNTRRQISYKKKKDDRCIYLARRYRVFWTMLQNFLAPSIDIAAL